MNPIERNAAVSKLTDEYVDALVADCIEKHGEVVPRLYEKLLEIAQANLPRRPIKVPEVTPMSEAEATAFSRQPMKWGSFKDVKISEVPQWYLVFLADCDFAIAARRYLKSSYYERISSY